MNNGREQFNYQEFIDQVKAATNARGGSEIAWDDVLMVSTEVAETAAMLQREGISPASLRRDIVYSLHFGRPEMMELININLPELGNLHRQAVNELLRDLRVYIDVNAFLSQPENRPMADQFMFFLEAYLQGRNEDIGHSAQREELAGLKREILATSLVGFIKEMAAADTAMTDQDTDDIDEMIDDAENADIVKILDVFHGYFQDKKQKFVRSMSVSEAFRHSDRTPFQILEIIKREVDAFLLYTLYRNGLLTPDDYEAPCQMPHPMIIHFGLQAYGYVENQRGKVVEPLHLLPVLLEDTTVIRTIVELDEEKNITEKSEPDPMMMFFGLGEGKGARNLIKFFKAVREAINPPQGSDRFRYRIRVSDEMKIMLLDAEKVIEDGDMDFAEARIFGHLIQSDPRVREVLMSAGLSEEQLTKWPEAIKKMEAKRAEERKKKPQEKKELTEFKVSDEELEELLTEYTSDRTKLALEGKLDPIIGRDVELFQIMRILLQRGRSNPLLLGEPGVGKTALFDGLAQAIAAGRGPKALIGTKIVVVDLSAMGAGPGSAYRGVVETKILNLIQGISERNARKDKPPIVLCIDELHAALQSGTAQGAPGAGELMKPYLTRGDLSVIGATTQRDYAKTIQADGALDRRFQTVFVGEPAFSDALKILSGLKDQFVEHHQLKIADTLLEVIVRLSDRYLPNQQQPDKAIRMLDAACARARMDDQHQLSKANVIETIAAEAKIDPEFLREGEEEKFLRLQSELPKQVMGQPQATQQIAESLITAKADLQDPRKPIGVFLLMGPTGVGKTETGRALSRLLHGTEENMIRIDMSDYREQHEASKLIGAPPGYIGFGEEGILTGAVRRQPYSVVVLDEIEKAHPEVLRRFLPVFEEGELMDGKGQKVSFRNTIILMTSNLGAQSATAGVERFGLKVDAQAIYDAAAKQYLAPEFLNRIDRRIVYEPLSPEVIHTLVATEIQKLSDRVNQKYGVSVRLDEAVYETLASQGYQPEYGARELKRVIMQTIGQPLASWILENRGDLKPKSVIEIKGLRPAFEVQVKIPTRSATRLAKQRNRL